MAISPSLTYQRIVLPTDLSACAERALPRALALAERAGADVHLLYVVAPLSSSEAVAPTLNPKEFGQWRRERARSRLEGLRLAYRYSLNNRHAVTMHTSIVTHADPSAGILSYARKHNADLIVMGSHGWSAHFGQGLGSVTQQVLTNAPCPVMTVPVHRTTAGLIRRVLLPVDNLSNMQALYGADYLAHLFQSRLLLLSTPTQPGDESARPTPVQQWIAAQPLQSTKVEYLALPPRTKADMPLLSDLEDTDVVVVPDTQAALRLARTGTCSVATLGHTPVVLAKKNPLAMSAA